MRLYKIRYSKNHWSPVRVISGSVLSLFVFTTIMFSCHPAVHVPVNETGTDTLSDAWQIQNSANVKANGALISSASYKPEDWYPAKVPTTVLNALVQNGVYTDIFRDENLKKIPGEQFKTSWWYRTSFRVQTLRGNTVLYFQGINYKADVWLNGHLVADTNTINNAFKQYRLDITKYLVKGENILAVEVFPPKAGDFSIGFVDWNPAPPDKDMGIFRPVILYHNAGVEISEPYIEAKLNETHSQAGLYLSFRLTNHLKTDKTGEIIINVAGKKLRKKTVLKAGETKVMHLNKEEFPSLTIRNPKLWWPSTVGKPHLYRASFSFQMKDTLSDLKRVTFGIRKISSFWTKKGHRGIMINGRKILVRGGGWVDNLLLNDSTLSLEAQLDYVKDMGLNAIRLEGFWGNSEELYRLCDEKGIMILTGWSCHWEWEDYLGKPCDENYGGILTDGEIALMTEAWRDQIVWLRNHPSVIVWFGGSDCKPKPQLEKNYFSVFREYDSTRIYLASAKEWSSLAGPTGVKMRGPYDYEPPVYWFSDTLYGGAFGFNTETGPGAQVPPAESLKKMFSPAHYQSIDSVWNYHCGRNEFHTLNRYIKTLKQRYGNFGSTEQFARKAQIMNYELMRPMFEAFSANRYQATGVIQWMLNSAWPELYWQLYDSYLMPNGAYYGAKKANRPLHVIYNYAENSLYIANDRLEDAERLLLKIKILNRDSKTLMTSAVPVNCPANSAHRVYRFTGKLPLSDVYFLSLRLYNNAGKEIDNNFYWLSVKKDLLDYQAEVNPWYYHTPSKQIADFTPLNQLPATELEYSVYKKETEDEKQFNVVVKNKGNHLAFFVYLSLVDRNSGETVLPVLWSDNYISLLPGEKRTLSATFKKERLKNKTVELKISAYNKVIVNQTNQK